MTTDPIPEDEQTLDHVPFAPTRPPPAVPLRTAPGRLEGTPDADDPPLPVARRVGR